MVEDADLLELCVVNPGITSCKDDWTESRTCMSLGKILVRRSGYGVVVTGSRMLNKSSLSSYIWKVHVRYAVTGNADHRRLPTM